MRRTRAHSGQAPTASTPAATGRTPYEIARYQLLSEHSRDAFIFARHSDAAIIEANRAAELIYGYTREELLNLTVYHLRADTTRPLDLEQMQQAMREGLLFETEHIRKDGSQFPVEVSSRGVLDGDGELIMLNVIRDTSQRELLQEIIRRHEEERAGFFSLDLDLMALTDLEGRVLHINQGAYTALGYRPEELEGIRFLDLIHPDDLAQVTAALQRLGCDDGLCELLERARHKDGTYRWIEWRARAHNGLVYALGHDITQRVEIQDELADQAERLEAVFQQSPAGIFVCDRDLVVTESNEKMVGLLDVGLDQFVGFDFKAADDDGIITALRRALDGEVTEYEGLYRTSLSDRAPWVSVRTSPLRGRDGRIEAAIAVLEDRTERKKADELIDKLAFTDPLTGLANRTLYRDRLRQAIAVAERNHQKLAVLALNVVRFRSVYDSTGQAGSDHLLQLLATGLTSCIRESDTVARAGHDDFLALLLDINGGRRLGRAVERLLAAAHGPWQVHGKEVRSGLRIGVAIFPDDGTEAEELMQKADWALREARAAGDQVAYSDPIMGERMRRRAQLEAELRHALDADEFVVYYQPQIDMRSGKPIGLEALVRWQHPERGLIPPFEFIPVAEEVGLIAELDDLVLRRACIDVKELTEHTGIPLKLAVNVSAAHLTRPGAAEAIASIVREADFERSQLEVEVTETAILSDIKAAEQSLQQLRKDGISVALDDFGTGYSSFSHLRQLSIHRLKIDRSFVTNLPDDREAGIIAETVVALAHTLGFGVIAEGVETKEQVRFLLEAGCTFCQGYLFGRPAPAADWTEQWARD